MSSFLVPFWIISGSIHHRDRAQRPPLHSLGTLSGFSQETRARHKVSEREPIRKDTCPVQKEQKRSFAQRLLCHLRLSNKFGGSV